MKTNDTQFLTLTFIAVLFLTTFAVADDVQLFHTATQDQWWDAVGDVTTIDFTGFENGEPLSNQYAHLGVRFVNVGPLNFFESGLFINDGWGFTGWNGAWILFDEPMNWIAADHPGVLGYELYSGNDLIYDTSFELGGTGTGHFSGLISSKPFDKVFLWKLPSGPFQEFTVAVDDLHFGALAVPAPGALPMLAVAFLFNWRRRRC